MTYGVFDVRDFGATGDNSTDDTAAFTVALDAAEALSSGGVVQVPPGQYFVDQIRMRTQVTLMGFGPSTTIRKNSGSTTPLIVLDTNVTNFTLLRDLRLRGNRYGGGGGGTAHGIDYQNSEDSAAIRAAELYGFHGDPQHRIFGVTIDAVDGVGMRIFCRETQISDCLIGDVTGDGIVLDGSDNWLANTSVNWVGRRGVVINGGNNRLVAVKCWYIGTDTSFEQGDAFVCLANRQSIVGCEAQDVSRYGLYLWGADYCTMTGMMLDNIGNFFKAQNQGFDHPPLLGGAIVARVSEANQAAFNRLDLTFGQRSSQSNLDSFVAFGTGVHHNTVDFSGKSDHILTPRSVYRKEHDSTYNNFATYNGQVA